MGVGARGCVRIYFPLVSWFIRRRKFACGNGSKARCVHGRSGWWLSYYQPCTRSFVFTVGISVLCTSKRHLWIPIKAGRGGENPNLLWLDGRIWWKKCGCLFPFPLPYLIYGDLWHEEPIPFARGTWDGVREALQTPLLKISFVNKHLWAWRTNANVSLLPLETETTSPNDGTTR